MISLKFHLISLKPCSLIYTPKRAYGPSISSILLGNYNKFIWKQSTKVIYKELSLTAREAFNFSTVCGSKLMLSWIAWSAQETKSFIAPVFFWSLAASNLSWQTIRDLFNFSCNQLKSKVRSKQNLQILCQRKNYIY